MSVGGGPGAGGTRRRAAVAAARFHPPTCRCCPSSPPVGPCNSQARARVRQTLCGGDDARRRRDVPGAQPAPPQLPVGRVGGRGGQAVGRRRKALPATHGGPHRRGARAFGDARRRGGRLLQVCACGGLVGGAGAARGGGGGGSLAPADAATRSTPPPPLPRTPAAVLTARSSFGRCLTLRQRRGPWRRTRRPCSSGAAPTPFEAWTTTGRAPSLPRRAQRCRRVCVCWRRPQRVGGRTSDRAPRAAVSLTPAPPWPPPPSPLIAHSQAP